MGARMVMKKPARTASKKTAKPQKVGTVTHYFTKIGVAVIKLNKTLSKGDKIKIQSDTPQGLTSFTQTVGSIQHNHKPLQRAGPGKEIGLKVRDRVRENDLVFKL
jgi:translation elongation factor EF-1alpha